MVTFPTSLLSIAVNQLNFKIMKKLFLSLTLAIVAQFSFGQSTVYVNGYYRSNGTYVQGHYRTAPNNTVYDNYSTYPNVNPYTGQTGTIHYNYNYNSNSNYNYNQNSNTYYYNNSYYTQPRATYYYNR